MQHAQLAERLGGLVGGPGNVRRVHVCATRLRFVVRDRSLVDRSGLGSTDGVAQVMDGGGQIQLVIGPDVEDVFRALAAIPGWSALASGRQPAYGEDAAGEEHAATAPARPLDRLFDLLAGTFQPLLAPLIGASMVTMLLRVALELGWYSTDATPPAVQVLTAASNAVFYFLPIFVGVTAARQLGANPYLSGAISASLLEPSFLAIGDPGDVSDFFGVPLYVFGYASSVFPAILIAAALSWLEPRLRRRVPKDLRLVVVPTVSLLLLVPLAVVVIGPIGVLLGQGLAEAIAFLEGVSPVLLSVAVAGSFLFLVAFGLHWALLPLVLVNLDQTGSDPIIAAMGAYNFAVWGLAVGVFVRARHDRQTRGIAGSGTLTGLLGGVSEPMLYGVILRYRRVIPIVVGAAVAGGVVAGLLAVRSSAVAFSSLLTIPLMDPVLGYVAAIAVSFTLALLGVLVYGYEQPSRPVHPEGGPAVQPAGELRPPAATVASPLSGSVVPLADVPDPVFAGGLIGPGVAIRPSSGVAVAAADGTIVMAPATGHAIGLRTADGIEVLVHVGIGTVALRGEGFRPRVEVGQTVRAGEVLVEFDAARIRDAGYSLLTPVVVTNAGTFVGVQATAAGAVAAGDALLTVTPKPTPAPDAT